MPFSVGSTCICSVAAFNRTEKTDGIYVVYTAQFESLYFNTQLVIRLSLAIDDMWYTTYVNTEAYICH